MPNKIERMFAEAELEVEFLDERQRVNFYQVMIAEDIREWAASPTGRYVLGAAQQDYDRVLEEIGEISPHSEQNVAQLHGLHIKLKSIEQAVAWLTEALREGLDAEQQLREDREEQQHG